MTGQVRGLPTSYRGWTFRSRLEARWAMLFDLLRLRWAYEPEGFDLRRRGAGLYVPDFWLPDLGCWVEVKPTCPSEVVWTKALALHVETRQPVFVVYTLDDGMAVGRLYTAYFSRPRACAAMFVQCRAGHADIGLYGIYDRAGGWVYRPMNRRCVECGRWVGQPRHHVQTVQQARFEYPSVRPVALVPA